MPANFGAIIVLVVALVSLVLAIISREIGSPSYLILFAIWLTLFLKASTPW